MKKIIAFVVLFSPLSVFAEEITNASGVAASVASIFNLIIGLLISLAVLFIIYNVVMYFVKGGESADRAAAGMSILWGIVGLFVILSIWGLVAILRGTFQTDDTGYTVTIPVPAVEGE